MNSASVRPSARSTTSRTTRPTVPGQLAEVVTARLRIPTIGIGAGPGCDGQIQVLHDALGFGTRTPKHAKRYANLNEVIGEAMAAYEREVRERRELESDLREAFEYGKLNVDFQPIVDARSGKVVLRIALQRLRRHYDRLGDDGDLMG